MMRTRLLFYLTTVLACGGWAADLAAQDVIIEARLFKGSRQPQVAGSDVVVSSFADPMIVSDDPAKVSIEQGQIAAMRAELFDIYHLRSVNHITTRRFIWDGKKKNLGGTITLSERNYPIAFYPELASQQGLRLRVAVNRLRDHSGIARISSPSERIQPVRTSERQEIIGGGRPC